MFQAKRQPLQPSAGRVARNETEIEHDMTSDHVQFEVKGRLGLITLNRPEALNALTFEMVDALDSGLAAWAMDPAVEAVAIRGEGDRAFCAGGDVRAIYANGPDGAAENLAFYGREYRMNNRIKTYPKPYISFMHGATMGGGVGVSAHGRYRIGAENLKFAMPETAIGFAPDVGGTYILARMPHNLGLWAGVSAAQMGIADAINGHLVDYFIRYERFDAVIDALAGADFSDSADEAICEILALNASAPDAPALKEHLEEIDAAFSAATIEGALAALKGGSAWAQGQAAAIEEQSPRSVKIAFGLIKAAAGLSFEACLANEYRMARAMMAHPDFYEGVRAKLIDKDRAPNWAEANVAMVPDALVSDLLTPKAGTEWSPA